MGKQAIFVNLVSSSPLNFTIIIRIPTSDSFLWLRELECGRFKKFLKFVRICYRLFSIFLQNPSGLVSGLPYHYPGSSCCRGPMIIPIKVWSQNFPKPPIFVRTNFSNLRVFVRNDPWPLNMDPTPQCLEDKKNAFCNMLKRVYVYRTVLSY